MSKYGAIAFGIALALGTVSTLSSKTLYEIQSIGRNGEQKHFEKPLLQTFFMFVAMSIALPLHGLHQLCVTPEARTPINLRGCLYLCLPSLADLVSTALGNVALLYVNVSFFQLARCTIMLYVASLKVLFLQFKLTPNMKLGIVINSAAIILISASCLAGASNFSHTIIGVGLLLLSCFVASLQYVLEEVNMKRKSTKDDKQEVTAKKSVNSPLVVIGMEGIWGTVMMLAVVLPIAHVLPGNDNGRVEDFFEAWSMLVNSTHLQFMCAIFITSITGFNIASIFVTYFLDALWRSLLVNFRPVAVWIASLCMYYIFTKHTFGEPWANWSWMQLGGMFMLFYGTAVYNGNIQFKCLQKVPLPAEKKQDKPVPNTTTEGSNNTLKLQVIDTHPEIIVITPPTNVNSCAA